MSELNSGWQPWDNPIPMQCEEVSRVNDTFYGCTTDASHVCVGDGVALFFRCYNHFERLNPNLIPVHVLKARMLEVGG